MPERGAGDLDIVMFVMWRFAQNVSATAMTALVLGESHRMLPPVSGRLIPFPRPAEAPHPRGPSPPACSCERPHKRSQFSAHIHAHHIHAHIHAHDQTELRL